MNATPIEQFYALSSVLTGYSRFELLGTGVGQSYYDTVHSIVGEEILQELLDSYHNLQQQQNSQATPSDLERLLRTDILSNPKLGPVARNIIKLWYLGSWYQMPTSWRETYRESVNDVQHVVSPQTYAEGLVWKAMDAHPMGAKQPGFGTWSELSHAE